MKKRLLIVVLSIILTVCVIGVLAFQEQPQSQTPTIIPIQTPDTSITPNTIAPTQIPNTPIPTLQTTEDIVANANFRVISGFDDYKQGYTETEKTWMVFYLEVSGKEGNLILRDNGNQNTYFYVTINGTREDNLWIEFAPNNIVVKTKPFTYNIGYELLGHKTGDFALVYNGTQNITFRKIT